MNAKIREGLNFHRTQPKHLELLPFASEESMPTVTEAILFSGCLITFLAAVFVLFHMN